MSAYAKLGEIDGEVMITEVFKGVSPNGVEFYYAETQTGDDWLVIQAEDGFDFYAVPDDMEQRLIDSGALDPTDHLTTSGIWDDTDQLHLLEDVTYHPYGSFIGDSAEGHDWFRDSGGLDHIGNYN